MLELVYNVTQSQIYYVGHSQVKVESCFHFVFSFFLNQWEGWNCSIMVLQGDSNGRLKWEILIFHCLYSVLE
jgi:hypothetical protein